MKPYKALLFVVGIHFFIMYALVFVAVNAFDDIKLISLRSLYMAIIMVTPMIALMVFFMRDMYENKRLNISLYVASLLVFIFSFIFIRQQIFVDNEQFIKSMIPHHSSAITMCEEANITDRELGRLCDEIIEAQQEEIDQMNDIMERLNE